MPQPSRTLAAVLNILSGGDGLSRVSAFYWLPSIKLCCLSRRPRAKQRWWRLNRHRTFVGCPRRPRRVHLHWQLCKWRHLCLATGEGVRKVWRTLAPTAVLWPAVWNLETFCPTQLKHLTLCSFWMTKSLDFDLNLSLYFRWILPLMFSFVYR